MRHAWPVVLLSVILSSGCTAVLYTSYEVATDQRSFETQHLDIGIAGTIKARLLESPVKGVGWIEVYCRRGVVVLTGIVEHGSAAEREVLAIARRVEGVKRIETYFLPSRPSLMSDYVIKVKVNARVVADWDLRLSQVSTSVLAGHVVLIGVVDRQDKVLKLIDHARATDGVVAVKSFVQVATTDGPAAPGRGLTGRAGP